MADWSGADDLATVKSRHIAVIEQLRPKRGGGEVVASVVLANAARFPNMSPSRDALREIKRRFGDVVRNEIGVEPAALAGP